MPLQRKGLPVQQILAFYMAFKHLNTLRLLDIFLKMFAILHIITEYKYWCEYCTAGIDF